VTSRSDENVAFLEANDHVALGVNWDDTCYTYIIVTTFYFRAPLGRLDPRAQVSPGEPDPR